MVTHRAAAAAPEGLSGQATTRPPQSARRHPVGGQNRLLVAGDARGVRWLHACLQTMEGLERAGFVAAYPPDIGMGRVTWTGDQIQLHLMLEVVVLLRGQVSPFSLETHKIPDTIRTTVTVTVK